MPQTRPYSKDTPSTVKLDDGTVRDVPERMTIDEFGAFPWPENSWWQLIWEVPILAASPAPTHQRLLAVLLRFIEEHLAARPELTAFATIDVSLESARSWVVPDIVVVKDDEVDYESRPFNHTPFLAVELLSPSTASLDVGPKRDAYAEAGVPEYWVVEPQSGAISLHVNPREGQYEQPPTDKDGFVASPLLGVTFRVSREGNRFKVITR